MRKAATKILTLPLALLCAAGLSAETIVVSRTSGGQTVLSTTERKASAEGAGLRVEESGEDGTTSALLAADGTVVSEELRAPDGILRLENDGKAVAVSGTWKGKAVSARCELKGSGFYGLGFGFAARAFARGGCKPLKFPSISPDKPSRSTFMTITKEGKEPYKGAEATKARIALSGALSAFWSARVLLDEEGRILRYEGNSGPGTPDFVTELVEVKG
jgi:hypothetical protein